MNKDGSDSIFSPQRLVCLPNNSNDSFSFTNELGELGFNSMDGSIAQSRPPCGHEYSTPARENFKGCFFLFFRIDVVNNRKREWQTKENNFYIWENFHVDAYNVQWACMFFDSPEFSHILLMTFVFFLIFARNYF